MLTEQPDVVIVATGGVANKGPIEGAELAVTSWDILTGKVAPGERVLLFDDHGGDRGLNAPSSSSNTARRSRWRRPSAKSGSR